MKILEDKGPHNILIILVVGLRAERGGGELCLRDQHGHGRTGAHRGGVGPSTQIHSPRP